ncbi:MAG: hypothetical protein NZ903_00625 [Candidatus Micrarchaeota archaeon]|nr:hypothetical protein [Candidatus Micrarchaeota archaeon]
MYFYVYVNETNKEKFNSAIYFTAGFAPFEDFIPIYEKSLSLQKELNSLVAELNESDEETKMKINEAQDAIDSFYIMEAETNINELKEKRGNLFIQLSNLFNSFVSNFLAFLNFPTNSIYAIPLFLSVFVLIFAAVVRIRRFTKYAIIFIAFVSMIFSVAKIVDPLLLIISNILLTLFILSILFSRKDGKGNRNFRSSDNDIGQEYEELIRRR